VTKSLNVSEKLNVFQLLITKLVKSEQSNDLDLQKEILTKLHKNGFDDDTISALYFSTLNICTFKKTFGENEAFIKKVESSNREDREKIAKSIGMNSSSRTIDQRTGEPFTKEISLDTVIEDKKELREELRENILNSTKFNVETIVNIINNNKAPVLNEATTLDAVLSVKPLVVDCNGSAVFHKPSI
jgi:hypothetical protein